MQENVHKHEIRSIKFIRAKVKNSGRNVVIHKVLHSNVPFTTKTTDLTHWGWKTQGSFPTTLKSPYTCVSWVDTHKHSHLLTQPGTQPLVCCEQGRQLWHTQTLHGWYKEVAWDSLILQTWGSLCDQLFLICALKSWQTVAQDISICSMFQLFKFVYTFQAHHLGSRLWLSWQRMEQRLSCVAVRNAFIWYTGSWLTLKRQLALS